MPTLRKGRRRVSKSMDSDEKEEKTKKEGRGYPGPITKKVGKAIGKGAVKVLEGYLKGTNKLADKISSVLPETTYDRSGRGGRGRRGRGGR